MVPVAGSFTRPRRFAADAPEVEGHRLGDHDDEDHDDDDDDGDENHVTVAQARDHPLPAPYANRTGLARRVNVPPTLIQTPVDLAPQDLWALLHEQEPGRDQHILAGSQAAEDFRATDVSRAFDLLRTRLRQTVLQHGWVNIAVCAPTAGCGNTFTAANLAASLSRVPSSRTVLIDLNMRKPGLARTLDMDPHQADSLRDFLAGDAAISDFILRTGDTLAVGLGAGAEEDAAEILQDPATADSLAEMRKALCPDIVLYDLPPMLCYDDTSAFLPQLDGVLLVSDGTQTMGRHLAECERVLDGQVPLLGVILNRARASSIERF